MKSDERDLWNLFGTGKEYEFPVPAGVELGMHPKRIEYLCGKWSKQGRYDWGVSWAFGWKTEYMMSKLEDYEIMAVIEDWDSNECSDFEKVQDIKKLLSHVWIESSRTALMGERPYLVELYIAQENPYAGDN